MAAKRIRRRYSAALWECSVKKRNRTRRLQRSLNQTPVKWVSLCMTERNINTKRELNRKTCVILSTARHSTVNYAAGAIWGDKVLFEPVNFLSLMGKHGRPSFLGALLKPFHCWWRGSRTFHWLLVKFWKARSLFLSSCFSGNFPVRTDLEDKDHLWQFQCQNRWKSGFWKRLHYPEPLRKSTLLRHIKYDVCSKNLWHVLLECGSVLSV